MANRERKRKASKQIPAVRSFPDKTVKVAKKAPPNLAGITPIQSPVGAGPPPLRLAKKKSLKNLNVVGRGQRKDLTSLVRRQAANTSLSHDQGSIPFLSTFFFYC